MSQSPSNPQRVAQFGPATVLATEGLAREKTETTCQS
jgi:hypothetical protein